MASTHFAPAAERADFADEIVDRIESVLRQIGDIYRLLNAEARKDEGKCIDSFTADPVKNWTEKATEALYSARKFVVIEAYDQRRRSE